MNWLIAGLAALIGYLSGSISFARIVAAIFAPGRDIEKLVLSVPDGKARIETNTVSATTIRMHLGARYGCLTSILDMLKAALPALVFRLWQPEAPYYLVAAGMATVGHNWPLYYRSKGGRGMSPILGGLFVVDWLGVLITHVVAFAVGWPLKNAMIWGGGGIVLMIPWLWIRTGNWRPILYAVLMNVLFWTAMVPELKQYGALRREGTLEEFQNANRLRVTGATPGEEREAMSSSAMLARITSVFRHSSTSGDPDGTDVPG